MNDPLSMLHDIKGLDSISWRPLPIGWWIVLLALFCFIVAIFYTIYKRHLYLKSWRYSTLQTLQKMEDDINYKNSNIQLQELSNYIRRIAIFRFPRNECAGLVGELWLEWLESNDPYNFRWTEKGKSLIEAPYAPLDHTFSNDKETIKEIIFAIKGWVR